MTTMTSPTLPARPGPRSPWRLISAELMKVRTTNAWWLFTIGILGVTALALLINGIQHHYELFPPLSRFSTGEQARAAAQSAAAHTPAGMRGIAADMMTSGQFFGALFAMLIG